MSLRENVHREVSRIEEWMEKHPNPTMDAIQARMRVTAKRLRKLLNQDDRIINGIQKEMDKLEHRCEGCWSGDEIQRHVDEAVTNVKVIERIEAIIDSLRRNTKEIGTGNPTATDSPRNRNLCVMTRKLAKVATGNADRLEHLVNELKCHHSSRSASSINAPEVSFPGLNASTQTDSTPTNSTTRSLGDTTTQNETEVSHPSTRLIGSASTSRETKNLVEDVWKIIRRVNDLEMEVATPSELEKLLYDLDVLSRKLEDEAGTNHEDELRRLKQENMNLKHKIVELNEILKGISGREDKVLQRGWATQAPDEEEKHVWTIGPHPKRVPLREVLEDQVKEALPKLCDRCQQRFVVEWATKRESLLQIVNKVWAEAQEAEADLREYEHKQPTNSGRDRLIGLSGRVRGIEMVFNAIREGLSDVCDGVTDRSTFENPNVIDEIQELLAHIVRTLHYVPVRDGGLGSVRQLMAFAKEIGLIE